MSKIKEIKTKVGEKTEATKEWFIDNKDAIIPLAISGGILAIGIGVSKLTGKKYETMWRAAKAAYDTGNLDHDFGPYKVMKFFEPKTGDFIGETLCHEDSVKMFLNLK